MTSVALQQSPVHHVGPKVQIPPADTTCMAASVPDGKPGPGTSTICYECQPSTLATVTDQSLSLMHHHDTFKIPLNEIYTSEDYSGGSVRSCNRYRHLENNKNMESISSFW